MPKLSLLSDDIHSLLLVNLVSALDAASLRFINIGIALGAFAEFQFKLADQADEPLRFFGIGIAA